MTYPAKQPAGRQDWRSTFKFFDRNNSGAISAQELHDALHTLGQERTMEEVHEMMASVGCSEGEELDFERYSELAHSIFQASSTITRGELKAMYATIDIDLSGYVTAAELRHFMSILKVDMDDEEMSEMINMYDLDGNNQISILEFENVLVNMGYAIVDDEDPGHGEKEGASSSENSKKASKKEEESFHRYPAGGERIALTEIPEKAREILRVFDLDNSGEVELAALQEAADLFKAHVMRNPKNMDEDPGLHWDGSREKRGLGDLVYKANHIGVIVSDVGRSSRFYSDVLGLQQIRRPNFDKHGAWFTMGNLEVHLIKGKPLVHSGDDLVVNHISVDTYGIDEVPARLKKLGVPFRQNVSVPKGEDGGAGGGTNDKSDSDKIVRQYFFRDPDGYYIEICNCMLLTEYCLGKRSSLEGYDESVRPLSLKDAAVTLNVMHKWATKGRRTVEDRGGTLEKARQTNGSFSAIGGILGCTPAAQPDEELLSQFKVRQTVYGDICQTFSDEELEEVCRVCGNDSRMAFEVMHIKAELDGNRDFQPPAFFEGGALVKPPTVCV